MFLPTPEQIKAFSELINSRGFAMAMCLFVLAGVLFYIVNPIPSKLDEILAVVRQGCLKVAEVPQAQRSFTK
jgi:hypothetical protein